MFESWAENWQARFCSLIQRMGHEDTFAFVVSRSGESFGEMFRAVRQAANVSEANFLAFVHLREMFYVDAAGRGQLREAFMEALVRSLRQSLRSGWNRGKRIRERRIDSRINWPVPHFVPNCTSSHGEWTAIQDRVWAELERLTPPDDWSPTDFNDPIIQDAFRSIWSQGSIPE